MCGIAGKVDFRGPVDGATVERMCDAMIHRGPDSRGVHAEAGVALGAQRLAIIDVAHGDQPLFNEDGSVVVVLNGEIYNHAELRRDLAARGHQFATHSDTEVIAHLYEDHGAALVNQLRGMFAVAVWDRRRRRLFLARDRVGKKPLFWAQRGTRFWFGSELRTLLEDPDLDRTVDLGALDAYLGLQYVPHPLSILEGVRKLPPASTLEFSEDGVEIRQYWSLDYRSKVQDVGTDELAAQVRELIWEATRIRLESEVPLGAFLSGGIDSSAVVAAMAEHMSQPVKTFSIGFGEPEYDELRFARLVAERFETDHHEFRVEPEALSIIPRLARHYGEPFADPSAIPSFYLAELTKQHVTVALNGDGGDESFAGYLRYRSDFAARLDGHPAMRAAIRGLSKHAGSTGGGTRRRLRGLGAALDMDPDYRYAHWMCMFDARSRERVESRELRAALGAGAAEDFVMEALRSSQALGRVDRLMDADVRTYLPGDLLVKMDIATMAHSVEARSPFLDQHLMEFAAALPEGMKIERNRGKGILKSALRGYIPDEVLDRRKMGFGVPLAAWFRNELRELPGEILLDPRTIGRGYFERAEVERLIESHRVGEADNSWRLWGLIQLEMWHREVLEGSHDRPDMAERST
jgi:asparagine synthase (glutamine-hydrolysing)